MTRPYREVLARQQTVLWGDRYARTMAQALFSAGLHNTPATFQAYIRKPPFGGSYLVSARQGIVGDWLKHQWRFDEETLDFLREETVINPATGQPQRLFTDDFLAMLADSKPELEIEALPEGGLAFPDEPVYRVTGPAWQALWVETAITNSLNSQSLFATLASRMVETAGGEPVTEYGLRRAHSIGGLAESRAAWIGGVAGTSNDQATFYYHIPASGTMAHAFVMFFDSEVEAFKSYLSAMPHNSVLLVDTFDTLNGVKNAISAAQETGVKLKGVRLDSGDLASLSLEVRQMLDAAGFTDTRIIASNNLDEYKISQMKAEDKNAIEVWAVGTRLTTTDRDGTTPAEASLGAVYKLVNVAPGLSMEKLNHLRDEARQGKVVDLAAVRDRLKLSETMEKSSLPGELVPLRHYAENGQLVGSTLLSGFAESPVDALGRLTRDIVSVNKTNPGERIVYPKGSKAVLPLRPLAAFNETIHEARTRAREELASLPEVYRQLVGAPRFPAGLDETLFTLWHKQAAAVRSKTHVRPSHIQGSLALKG